MTDEEPYTNSWVIEFEEGASKEEVDEIASQLGFESVGKVSMTCMYTLIQ